MEHSCKPGIILLGTYKIISQIGSGSFGKVFLGKFSFLFNYVSQRNM